MAQFEDDGDGLAPLTGGKQCTARSKRSGQRCKNGAVTGFNVCRMHGGKSLSGAKSSRFKHGRYSKYGQVLPRNVASVYEEMLTSEEILGLHDEIALVDAKIVQFISEGSISVSGWRRLKRLWLEFRADLALQNVNLGPSFLKIADLIEEGVSESKTWEAMLEAIETRRKLVDTERKRAFEETRAIPIEHLVGMMSRVLEVIKSHVPEPERQVEIGKGIRLLLKSN